MGSTALIQTLRDAFSNYSGVKTLFGDPVETQGKLSYQLQKLLMDSVPVRAAAAAISPVAAEVVAGSKLLQSELSR